jgi:hypothetical protein
MNEPTGGFALLDDTPQVRSEELYELCNSSSNSSISEMAPRRSVRSKGPAFKKGDYIEVRIVVTSEARDIGRQLLL